MHCLHNPPLRQHAPKHPRLHRHRQIVSKTVPTGPDKASRSELWPVRVEQFAVSSANLTNSPPQCPVTKPRVSMRPMFRPVDGSLTPFRAGIHFWSPLTCPALLRGQTEWTAFRYQIVVGCQFRQDRTLPTGESGRLTSGCCLVTSAQLNWLSLPTVARILLRNSHGDAVEYRLRIATRPRNSGRPGNNRESTV